LEWPKRAAAALRRPPRRRRSRSRARLPMAAGSSVSWLSPSHSLVSAVRLPMEADPWTLLTMLRFTAQA